MVEPAFRKIKASPLVNKAVRLFLKAPFLALWFRRVRTSPVALLGISLLINVGMYIERFLIVTVDSGNTDTDYAIMANV